MTLSSAYDIRKMRLGDVIAVAGGGSGNMPLAPADVIVTTARPEEYGLETESKLVPVLSEDERARMDRFRSKEDGRLFLLSHALLRMTLSLCAGVEPRDWQFLTGKYGRPEITKPSSRLRFSIAHTRGLAACAIVLDRDIGFDVEDTSKDAAIDILEGFFSSEEAQDLRSTPRDLRSERFFTYWTLKEAYVKARGIGLSLPLNRFSMYEDSESIWRISFHSPLADDPNRWWFWSSHVSEKHRAALALSPARR